MHTEDYKPVQDVVQDFSSREMSGRTAKRFLDKDAVKAAARGNWSWILHNLNVRQECLKNSKGPCPVSACEGKKSFRFDDKKGDGTFICTHCGAGDGFKLAMLVNRWPFYEALKAVAGILHLAPSFDASKNTQRSQVKQIVSEVPELEILENILARWTSGFPIENDDAAGRYLLESRGLPLKAFPDDLRFFDSICPELLAAFRSATGGTSSKFTEFYSLAADRREMLLPSKSL